MLRDIAILNCFHGLEFIEYVKPFWLCETTRRCLGFAQILLRYSDPLDVPTHLIGD